MADLLRGIPKRGRAEACVSFSRKFSLENYGGPRYESIDFFASRKVECEASDLDTLSDDLHQECVEAVEAQARRYILEMRRKQTQQRKAAVSIS